MTYVVSDLHGSMERYNALLSEIGFSDKDVLYVIGDIVDYGEDPMGILCDMSMRANVLPIVGEHDYKAARMLYLYDKFTKEGGEPDPTFVSEMNEWVKNGGASTLAGFRELDDDMKEGVLDYLADMALYEEVTVKDENYLLVHAGIRDFTPDLDLESCAPDVFISEPLDLEREYYEDKQIIVGHVPVSEIPEADAGMIYYGNGSIAIDCGAAFGGKLACLCLDNGKEYYI